MSEQIRNAIDGGLYGLRVNEGHVAAILRRARADGQEKPRRRTDWRPVIALAVVMLAMVAAVGWRLSTSVQDAQPLNQPDVQTTEVPAGFVPVEEEPIINIDMNRATALAESYVLENHDSAVNLRDGACYAINCEYVAREEVHRNFYRVDFCALTAEGTAYALRVSAEDGSILSCDVQRGAQPGHTAQEILAGYARLYGPDRRTWTNAQLRLYCQTLKKAAAGTLRWEDYLYLLSSYPDVAEGAMTREEVLAWTMADLDLLLFEHDGDTGAAPRWQDAELLGEPRARYISAYPNPVWKVAVEQRAVNQEGYETIRTILIEVDSVTQAVLRMETVDALYSAWHESFARSTIDALMATTTSGDGHPGLTDEARGEIAAAYVREVWGEERDINDPDQFTLTETFGDPACMQCQQQLTYRSTGAGEVTEYVLWIDDYGQVLAANRSVTPAGSEPFTPTAPALDWRLETLQLWQERAREIADAEDAVMRVFCSTVWLGDYYDGSAYSVAEKAVYNALDVRAATNLRAVLIGATPNPVWKLAFSCDAGSFLAEVDSVTMEILHLQQVENIWQNWYLPYVLTADMQAAGMPVPVDYESPAWPLAEAHNTADGMRVDHLYTRFRQIYGPDMGAWTQEQLRTFQQMVMLSSDYDYDLGVPCLRATIYPDIPDNAISREEAMRCAATAIGNGHAMEDWTLCGAVLIGTAEDSAAGGTPVWKVCMQQPGGDFWYAEVNCMTGKVYRLHQDASGVASPGASYDYGTPQNLWFRDIVLEETIEDCEAVWECRGNG
ncbi:MAG: hypothetical protein IJE07_02195 [Clostridia bacterium]|nr:hypothetical protein [Clostridia bacterium]